MDPKKQLVYNIIDFLRTSAQDGTVKEDDKESLDVAKSFDVDPEDKKYSIAPATLLSLLDVFSKTKAKAAPDAKQAEGFKAKGNELMGKKDYEGAIEQYNQAIAIEANPVYYSNRAAAWGALGDHDKAVEDATRAIELDPKFAKGHAQFSLGEYAAAVDAYERGLALDPGNSNMKTALATAKAKAPTQVASEERGAGGMPDLSSMLGGGMPDLASLMQNPQMMQMAQQMMQNGGLERLMQNPAMRQMAERFQGGGEMPDLNDPALRDMASQFMNRQ